MSAPTINVNLKQCTCRSTTPYGPAQVGQCMNTCPGAPVPIPLSLEPFRSVTFAVVVDTCTCHPMPGHQHVVGCRGSPIRVSCSISGKTWEESEVADVEWSLSEEPTFRDFSNRFELTRGACRERWALVKALVLGTKISDYAGWCGPSLRTFAGLFHQRDVVFSVLTGMARAEDTARQATEALWRALPASAEWKPRHPARDTLCPSAELLARYVEHLIEQVGALVQ